MSSSNSCTYTNPALSAAAYLQWINAAQECLMEYRHFSRWNPSIALLNTEGKIWINCYPRIDVPHPDFI